jgi:hypothetical protein
LGPSRVYDEEGITDEDWDKLRYVGDGMASATDPRDPNIIYLVQQFGNTTRMDLRDWERIELQPTPDELQVLGIAGPGRYNWSPAIVLSEHDPDYIYLGGNYLFRIHGETGDVQRLSDDLTWQQDRSFRGIWVAIGSRSMVGSPMLPTTASLPRSRRPASCGTAPTLRWIATPATTTSPTSTGPTTAVARGRPWWGTWRTDRRM